MPTSARVALARMQEPILVEQVFARFDALPERGRNI